MGSISRRLNSRRLKAAACSVVGVARVVKVAWGAAAKPAVQGQNMVAGQRRQDQAGRGCRTEPGDFRDFRCRSHGARETDAEQFGLDDGVCFVRGGGGETADINRT